MFLAEEVFAKMFYDIAHVRYIKILTCLQGFLVIFLYLVWFDNAVVQKNCNFVPKALASHAGLLRGARGRLIKPQSHVRILV